MYDCLLQQQYFPPPSSPWSPSPGKGDDIFVFIEIWNPLANRTPIQEGWSILDLLNPILGSFRAASVGFFGGREVLMIMYWAVFLWFHLFPSREKSMLGLCMPPLPFILKTGTKGVLTVQNLDILSLQLLRVGNYGRLSFQGLNLVPWSPHNRSPGENLRISFYHSIAGSFIRNKIKSQPVTGNTPQNWTNKTLIYDGGIKCSCIAIIRWSYDDTNFRKKQHHPLRMERVKGARPWSRMFIGTFTFANNCWS